MTEPGIIMTRAIINRWRSGENSADIAKCMSLTEQEVLRVIWGEREERRRVERWAGAAQACS